ncbi:MAG: hypothetical protein KDB29_07690, partial [Planctomycetes bacterium]|nr:hypothetical protein [Planctomycetota bacterium]
MAGAALVVLAICIAGVAVLVATGDRGNEPAPTGNQDQAESAAEVVFEVIAEAGHGSVDLNRAEVWIASATGRVVSAERQDDGTLTCSLADGSYSVIASVEASGDRRSSWVSSVRLVRVPADAAEKPVRLEVGPSARLDVIVQDSTGQPVPNAVLSIKFPASAQTSAVQAFHGHIVGTSFDEALVCDARGHSSLQLFPLGIELEVSASGGSGVSEPAAVVLDTDSEVVLTVKPAEAGLRATLVNPRGDPVANHSVRCETIDGYGEVVRSFIARTNDRGHLVIPLSAAGYLRLQSDDERSFMETQGRLFQASNEWQEILVYPAISFSVKTQYQDGTPCLGEVRVVNTIASRQFAPAPPAESLSDAEVRRMLKDRANLTGTVKVKQFPQIEATSITVSPMKAGYYDSDIEVDLTKTGNGETITLTVSGDRVPKRTGTVLLTLADDLTGPVHVSLISTTTRYAFFDGTVRESVETRVPRGTFVAVATSAETAWESPIVSVNVGEQTVVEILRRDAGTVSETVVDEAGDPIDGACIEVDKLQAPQFPEQPVPGVVALSNSAGALSLGRQAAGWRAYRVEAPGFLPLVREVQVASGQVTDLGSVRLERSTYSLKIERDGEWEADLEITAVLSPLYVRSHEPETEHRVEDSTVWEGLVPGRRYTLVLRCFRIDESGGRLGRKLVGSYSDYNIVLSEVEGQRLVPLKFVDLELAR